MPQDLRQSDEFTRPLRRILQAVIILCLLGVFMVWRIDSPRVERFRSHVIDQRYAQFHLGDGTGYGDNGTGAEFSKLSKFV